MGSHKCSVLLALIDPTWCHHQSPQRPCREAGPCSARLLGFSPPQLWAGQWWALGWCAAHWQWQTGAFYQNTPARRLRKKKDGSSQATENANFELNLLRILVVLSSPCKPLGRSIVFTSSSAMSNAFNPLSFRSQNSWPERQMLDF